MRIFFRPNETDRIEKRRVKADTVYCLTVMVLGALVVFLGRLYF